MSYQQTEDDGVTPFQKAAQDLVGDYEALGSTKENELRRMKNLSLILEGFHAAMVDKEI